MKGRFRKTALAAAAALLVVSGNVPIKPAADLFGGVAVTVSAAEVASGTCGDNATWSLDDTGTLTISGTGDMDDIDWGVHRGEITSVEIEDGVTSIGDSAFMGCRSLTSVKIPSSVTTIGNDAFNGCTGLTSVEIPDSVTSIGDCAFCLCTLTSVEIPNSVTSIGDYAFDQCRDLTSIVIPAKVTNIGADAFRGCIGITDVYCYGDPLKLTWNERNCDDFISGKETTCYVPGKYLVDYSEKFGESVNVTFEMNPALPGGKCGEKARWEFDPTTYKLTISGTGDMSGYTYGNGVSYAEPPWSAYIDNITSVVIEKGITSVGDFAFFSCTSLTSVKIPDSVKSIGNYAFSGCKSLTSVEIPNSVKSIGDSAFEICTALTSITIPDSVTSIGNYAFFGCKRLTSAEIPNSVTSISEGAFSECSGLTSITIPSGVTSIRNYAFDGCASLTSVEIPNSVTSIGEYAFNGCTVLTSVTIPDRVTTISYCAFSGCKSLTSVKIPNSVTSIGSYAFSGCTGLTSVKIPDSVTSIGADAFYYCTGLTSIAIPNSVTSIGDYVFYNCTSLTSVEIPNSVTSIGRYAFHGCTGLTSITIPNSVESIGSSAFQGCESLTSVTIPNSVTSIGIYAFHGCTDLTSVKIPNSVTSITEGAFYDCPALTSVEIPNSVTSIEGHAFRGCESLTSIAIPANVTSIGVNAFDGCTGLTSIAIPAGVTSIDGNAFYGCTNIKDVYCYANPKNLTWDDSRCDDFKPGKETVCHVSAEHLGVYKTKFDESVNVRFVTDVTVTVADGITNGTVTPDKTKVYSGDTVTLTVTPDASYAVKSVKYNDTEITPVNGVYSFEMPAEDVTVTAVFGHTVAIDNNITNGTVSADLPVAENNEAVTLTVTPAAGYAVKSVTVNDTAIDAVNGVYSFTMPAEDVTVSAEFELQKCTVTLPEHMEIINGDVLTEGKADYGTEIIFKVSDGYTAANVKNGETELIPDESGIYTVTVEGDTVITADIQKKLYELRAYGLRLNGDIGLDVYFGIDESVIKDVTRMDITLPNGGKQTVYAADFDPWGNGLYCFSAKVAAKEMTDKVRFELYTNDTAPVCTADVSVRDAALVYLNDNEKSEDELVKAMLNYGAYSQLYFGHNIANLANAGYEYDDISAVTAAELGGYQYDPTTEDLPEGLSFAKVNLTLESETSLNLYFTDNTGADVSYTSDIGDVEVTNEKGFTKVAIRNIPAEELGSYATVTITVDGNSSYSVKYSPMTYCYNTLTRDGKTEDLRDCMRAFYLYNKEADAYSTSMHC